MLILAGVGFLCLISYDASLLRGRDQRIYAQTLKIAPVAWAGVVVLSFFVLAPIYLLRRQKFLKTFSESMGSPAGETDFDFLTDALGIVILWPWIVLLISLVLLSYAPHYSMLTAKLARAAIGTLSASLGMVALIYGVTRKYPGGFRLQVGLEKKGQPFWKMVLIPLAAGVFLAIVAVAIAMLRQDNPVTPLNEIIESNKSPSALLLFIGAALFVGPFLEELIFRGYFFSVVRRLKGRLFAVYFIAALFTIFHVQQYWGDGIAVAMVGLLSLTLSWLRLWSDSTIPGIITHYTYNILITVVPIAVLILSNFSYVKYMVFYEQLNPSQQEELLLESIRQRPDNIDAYNNLAWLYAQEDKNLDEALDLIEEALAADPENSAYLDTKAEILYRLGYFDEAIAIEEGLAEAEPQNQFYQSQLEKFKKAEEHKNPLEDLDPLDSTKT